MRSRESIVRQLEHYRNATELDEPDREVYIGILEWVLDVAAETPEGKLALVEKAAKALNSSVTQISSYDDRNKLISYACYATGPNAKILQLFAERLS